MRLSDAERQDALDALAEHMSTGRLDVEEFSNRADRVGTAGMRSDLVPIFADLPHPHPAALGALARPAGDAPEKRTISDRIVPRTVPIATVAAVAFVSVVLLPIAPSLKLVFLLPLVVALLLGLARRPRR
ncbi:hypothetical protein CFN78_02460 [Amycolatopsis antarctica]|uniref:DUF1707 domain-containing protein n=1 Tax=Amycolatopsis antarctica TaxID=1854586 RepID=A0A263DAX2_9PSEU|nr:DUF1707 domain-containing protein [Amycolatopsis antarctica]OZM75319.1 hypothetical protein CFN78_02460 [Amycolatopsis antarctica]